jgi:hypothetical protein
LLSLTICGEGWLVLFGTTVWHEGWLIIGWFWEVIPAWMATDPTVLQDHTSLLNKLGGGQIQSGTYSVTVSAHRVPSSNTSPIDFTSNQLRKGTTAVDVDCCG